MTDQRLTDMDFPEGERFKFHDDPGEHAPCYVVMPGGAALPINHHAGPGVDVARAKFIVRACNHLLAGYLKHPRGVLAAPYIVGRWMVTGPDFEDGTGWTLCQHEGGECKRCVASFERQGDAEHAARLHNASDGFNAHLSAGLKNAERAGRMTVVVDPSMPEDQIAIEHEGQEVARIVNIGQESAGQDQ